MIKWLWLMLFGHAIRVICSCNISFCKEKYHKKQKIIPVNLAQGAYVQTNINNNTTIITSIGNEKERRKIYFNKGFSSSCYCSSWWSMLCSCGFKKLISHVISSCYKISSQVWEFFDHLYHYLKSTSSVFNYSFLTSTVFIRFSLIEEYVGQLFKKWYSVCVKQMGHFRFCTSRLLYLPYLFNHHGLMTHNGLYYGCW